MNRFICVQKKGDGCLRSIINQKSIESYPNKKVALHPSPTRADRHGYARLNAIDCDNEISRVAVAGVEPASPNVILGVVPYVTTLQTIPGFVGQVVVDLAKPLELYLMPAVPTWDIDKQALAGGYS